MNTRTFFRLVISSVMSVRITSATSSIVRTCSWNDGHVSTTTNAYDSRSVSRTFLMLAPVMSSAAHAALRREERDDLAALRPERGADVLAARAAAGLLLLGLLLLVALPLHLLDLVDVTDRVHELVR